MARLMILWLSTMFTVVVSARKLLPNIVIIMPDDIGYGDLHYLGHPTQERNEIDQLADEGLKFTHYMAAERYCTPNRAAMLTSRYAVRYGLYGSTTPVFIGFSSGGLPKSEITLPEALKDIGYKTGMVGKWHLGLNQYNRTDGLHLPDKHGFDYVGLNLPLVHTAQCMKDLFTPEEQSPFCFLYNGSTLIEQPYDTSTLNPRLVDDAKSFIRKNKDNPFFLFASWPQPHDISFSSDRFAGKSKRGTVGDSINEVAWMTGEVINELKRNNLEKQTLVLFLNDHGPSNWGCQPNFSSGPFRGVGGTGWEGSFRGPAIAWWPGKIKSGETSEIFSVLDVFPTLLTVAGAPRYLKDRNVSYDGKVIHGITGRKSKRSPKRFLLHYCGKKLMAARLNQHKMHFLVKNLEIESGLSVSENKFCDLATNFPWIAKQLACDGPTMEVKDPPLLFNTDEDPNESFPLDTEKYSQLVEDIKRRVALHEATLTPQDPGILNAPADHSLTPCCNPPTCLCPYENE